MTQYTAWITQFAATYNCDAYGSGQYNQAGECVTSETTTPGGSLTNTGVDMYIYGGIGLALVIAGAVLLVRLLRKKKA